MYSCFFIVAICLVDCVLRQTRSTMRPSSWSVVFTTALRHSETIRKNSNIPNNNHICHTRELRHRWQPSLYPKPCRYDGTFLGYELEAFGAFNSFLTVCSVLRAVRIIRATRTHSPDFVQLQVGVWFNSFLTVNVNFQSREHTLWRNGSGFNDGNDRSTWRG